VDGAASAVVLAGGRSRRFGSDKLVAPINDVTMLELTLAGLSADMHVWVVGPTRSLASRHQPVRFVREQPPGGGPAAALVAGLRAALDGSSDRIVVLPGDAPRAGGGAELLLAALEDHPEAIAAMGVDERGVEQPLQLALRRAGAEALVAAAGARAGRDASARSLVRDLEPPPRRVPLPQQFCQDIDTTQDLAAFLPTAPTSTPG
jgi:molybdenum cofactor guanylyltransferase